MSVRETLLLAILEVHSGNAAEGQAIVDAVLTALRERAGDDVVASKMFSVNAEHTGDYERPTIEGTKAVLLAFLEDAS